jgi:uncharacterized protein YcbK (DUF882 family)
LPTSIPINPIYNLKGKEKAYMRIARNFTDDEFKCPCCGKEEMDRDFVEKLQIARDIANIPFRINSGWRCQSHNQEVGGVQSSSHLKGLASDIQAENSQKRFTIVKSLTQAGFQRIGVAKTFIHVDDDTDKVQDVIWLY